MNITKNLETRLKDEITKKLKEEATFVLRGKTVEKKRISNISLIYPLEDNEFYKIHFNGTCKYTSIGEISGSRRFEGYAIVKVVHIQGTDIDVEIEFKENIILK